MKKTKSIKTQLLPNTFCVLKLQINKLSSERLCSQIDFAVRCFHSISFTTEAILPQFVHLEEQSRSSYNSFSSVFLQRSFLRIYAAKIDPFPLVRDSRKHKKYKLLQKICFLAKVFLQSQSNKISEVSYQRLILGEKISKFLTSVLHISETGVVQFTVKKTVFRRVPSRHTTSNDVHLTFITSK